MKLTDNMIFLFAGLPRESYQVVQKIYQKYEAQEQVVLRPLNLIVKAATFES